MTWVRRETVVFEYSLDGACVDPDPHAPQLFGDAPLTPGTVLALQSDDEFFDARI
ncbi:MAG: hypothetical protein R3B89_07940 [Polyangiaceae bacterium]